jgi:TRAP-type C4-dicarboxylate transport system permease small subunit
MLGSIVAVRERTHFDVDILPEPRSTRGKGIMRLIVHLAMGILAWFFATDGWQYAFSFGSRQTGDVVPVSLLVIYVTVPLAGISWGLFLLEHIVHDIRAILGREDLDDSDGPANLPDAGQDRIGQGGAL